MARELVAYRDNLERVIEAFPNKEMLNITEVRNFFKMDVRTVKKLIPFRNEYISIATLARYMSMED